MAHQAVASFIFSIFEPNRSETSSLQTCGRQHCLVTYVRILNYYGLEAMPVTYCWGIVATDE
jgi:hypothetical protein